MKLDNDCGATHLRTRGRLGHALLGIWTTASLIACAAHTNSPKPDATQIASQLRAKPSFEAAQAEYKTLIEETADKIAALTPGINWTIDEDSWVGCAYEYDGTGAKQVYIMAVFSGPIPDSVWPQALRIAQDAAAKIGATESTAFKDRSNDHDVAISGAKGIQFQLGTQKAAVLTARSDCRLRQSDMPPSK